MLNYSTDYLLRHTINHFVCCNSECMIIVIVCRNKITFNQSFFKISMLIIVNYSKAKFMVSIDSAIQRATMKRSNNEVRFELISKKYFHQCMSFNWRHLIFKLASTFNFLLAFWKMFSTRRSNLNLLASLVPSSFYDLGHVIVEFCILVIDSSSRTLESRLY